MLQTPLFVESFEEALSDAVRALKGPKAVGQMLWPEKPMDIAAKQLNACLDPDRDEKLSLSQILLIAKRARAVGCDTVMAFLGKELAYDCKPISKETLIDRLNAETAAITEKLSAQLRSLQEQTARIAELSGDNVASIRRAA
jgi:hypothetical protein